LAFVGARWRPASAALDSGHIDVDGRSVGGVAVSAVVATGAGSQPIVAHDASGQRVAHSSASGGALQHGVPLIHDGTKLIIMLHVVVGINLLLMLLQLRVVVFLHYCCLC
jgi:hypothetical protein